MRLVIVRHGETIDNLTNTIQGQSHGQLSDLGKEQAKKLAQRLKNEEIDFIYCSDLKRTKDTLIPLLEFHKNTPVVYEPLLRERGFGIFDGKLFSELEKSLNGNEKELNNFRPVGGENHSDVRKRVISFLQKLIINHKDNETILILTHAGWKTNLISHLQNTPLDELFTTLKLGNTAVTIIDFKKNGKHQIELINSTNHLDK